MKEKIKSLQKIYKLFFEYAFIAAGIILLFFLGLRPTTDPDFGWHLMDGKYLLDHHMVVAKLDIFSYTMPNFPLIMHEWLTDTLMFIVYKYLGLLSLSILFAAITAAAYLIAAQGIKAKFEYKMAAALLTLIASQPIIGVRPQMVNLLGIAIMLWFIFKFRDNPKTKSIYWLPVVLAIWVNFHGGFAVGLFMFGLYLAIEFYKYFLYGLVRSLPWTTKIKETIISKLKPSLVPFIDLSRASFVLVISALATLLNQYGWRVYVEVVTTIFDKYAKANIGEWLPVQASNPMSFQFIIYLTLLFILLLFSYRKIDYVYLLFCLVFLVMAFSSWRHMPLFLIVSIPLWVTIVEHLAGKELKKLLQKKFIVVFMLVIVTVMCYQRWQEVWYASVSEARIAEAGSYPYGAVQYLKTHNLKGNMLNEYNWGGFLIWQYPQQKVFIDGRMPSWKQNGYSVFKDFNELASYQEGWKALYEKHDFGFVLLYNSPINQAMLEGLEWKQAYADQLSIIYVNPKYNENIQ